MGIAHELDRTCLAALLLVVATFGCSPSSRPPKPRGADAAVVMPDAGPTAATDARTTGPVDAPAVPDTGASESTDAPAPDTASVRADAAAPDTASVATPDVAPADVAPADAAVDTATPTDVSIGSSLPAPWRHLDIGDVAAAGSATFAGGTFTLAGSGTDIWDAADGFTFVTQPFSGDGEIVARVASVQMTHEWSKAGVMFRAALSAGSRHTMMVVTGAGASSFQHRVTDGATSGAAATGTAGAPRWVKVIRIGKTFRGYVSADGTSWTLQGSIDVDMPAEVQVGLVTTSHNNGVTATSMIDNVTITRYPPYPTGLDGGVGVGPPPPAPWSTGDVGFVGVAGQTGFTGGVFTQSGSGADIWGTADGFTYAFQPRTGDFVVTARVVSVEMTDPWAKAGVMARAATDPSSPHATVVGTPGNGVRFQYRAAAGGGSTDVASALTGLPAWVRLTRRGTTVTGSVSTDGTTWTNVGTTELPQSTVQVGLVTTAHNNGLASKAVLDNVTVAP